jgi:hypothetical protein
LLCLQLAIEEVQGGLPCRQVSRTTVTVEYYTHQKFLTSPLGIVIALRRGIPDRKSEKKFIF